MQNSDRLFYYNGFVLSFGRVTDGQIKWNCMSRHSNRWFIVSRQSCRRLSLCARNDDCIRSYAIENELQRCDRFRVYIFHHGFGRSHCIDFLAPYSGICPLNTYTYSVIGRCVINKSIANRRRRQTATMAKRIEQKNVTSLFRAQIRNRMRVARKIDAFRCRAVSPLPNSAHGL